MPASRRASASSVRRPVRRVRPECSRGPGHSHAVVSLAVFRDCAPEKLYLGRVVARRDHRRVARPLEELRLLRRVRRHSEGLLEERDGLLIGAEVGRTLGGRGEGDPGLGREGVGSGPRSAFWWAAR